MALETTLSIIKPDAVENGHIGAILNKFEQKGLKILSTKMVKLTQESAQQFYSIHKERPFFNDLVSYMTSGPVVVSALEGENAVLAHRAILGATNPTEAEAGTVRKDFGESIERNAAHGSDSVDNAKIEINHFFDASELQTYQRKN